MRPLDWQQLPVDYVGGTATQVYGKRRNISFNKGTEYRVYWWSYAPYALSGIP